MCEIDVPILIKVLSVTKEAGIDIQRCPGFLSHLQAVSTHAMISNRNSSIPFPVQMLAKIHEYSSPLFSVLTLPQRASSFLSLCQEDSITLLLPASAYKIHAFYQAHNIAEEPETTPLR